MTDVNRNFAASTQRPDVVINMATLQRIEALAESALKMNPELAEKLLDELVHAEVVAPDRVPAGIVGIGNAVTYRDEASGQEKTVTLVFPEDADISQRRISVMTPLGVALLGLAEGAVFYWDTRDGSRRPLSIVRVEAS